MTQGGKPQLASASLPLTYEDLPPDRQAHHVLRTLMEDSYTNDRRAAPLLLVSSFPHGEAAVKAHIEKAIRAAVEAEREACLGEVQREIASRYATRLGVKDVGTPPPSVDHVQKTLGRIRDAIRSRGRATS